MVTRREVLHLVQGGLDYEQVGARLNISPGKAYLIATGLPADGGDSLTPVDRRRPGFVESSTQALANPQQAENPVTKGHVLEWVKQRAHSDAQQQQAAADRTPAPGEIEDPNDDRDIATVLTRDHDQVTALVKQMKTIPGHADGASATQVQRRESVVDMIRAALSQHEAAEQEVFWPKVREVVPDGDRWAEQALEQEQEGKNALAALADTDPDSADYDDLTEELAKRLRAHVAFEDRLLLELTKIMDNDARQELGRAFRDAEKRAPTKARAKGES